MPSDLAIEYHKIILVLFVGFILFVGGKTLGAFLETTVKEKITKKGSKEKCADCYAMQIAVSNIPVIEGKQDDFRKHELPAITNRLAEINTSISSLDGRVKKLFTMIEDDWKEELAQLRQAVREKNTEIERLKSKV